MALIFNSHILPHLAAILWRRKAGDCLVWLGIGICAQLVLKVKRYVLLGIQSGWLLTVWV